MAMCVVVAFPIERSVTNSFQAIGDQAAQRAIDLDHKHGVSNKFLDTLNKFDQKYHVFLSSPSPPSGLNNSDRLIS
jgi:hypothetical protein